MVERLPSLVAELIRLKVDVLATAGTPASRAAQKATTAIPIVMITVGNPVGDGLVESLARPGGNSTGLSSIAADLGPKLLELLLSIVPRLSRVAILVNPANPYITSLLKNIQAAAYQVSVQIVPVEVGSSQGIANAFALIARRKAGAVIVPLEQLFQDQRSQIVQLTARHRLPSIGAYGGYAEAGGLVSYGQDVRENFWRAAAYVDKIFKGAKPGDIPMEQPTKLELFVNRKTAKALGLTIPQSLLISADKIIE